MSRPTIGLLALILLTLPLAATAQEAPQARARVGDRLDPADYGPGIIESMEAAVARDLERRASAALSPAPEAAKRGEWAVPSPGAAEHPHSGTHYVVNKYGATDMGVGFPTVMDVHGAYFAGQGGRGVWATAIRVYGYRDGVEVAATDWFTDLGAEPAWFPMNLTGVDCITIEAAPVYGGAAWYAMDDFTFSPSGADYQIVLDFEDTRFKQVLTGTDYASLSWETGSEGFRPQPDIVDAPAPCRVDRRRGCTRPGRWILDPRPRHPAAVALRFPGCDSRRRRLVQRTAGHLRGDRPGSLRDHREPQLRRL